MDDLVQEVRRYYQGRGISAEDFECKKHRLVCSKGCDKFSTAVEPYIGEEYNNGNVKRLLFISLDPVPPHPEDLKSKTIEGVKEQSLEWAKTWPHKDKQLHWYRTHQFVWHVFKQLNSERDIGEVDDKYDFKSVDDLIKIMPFFAHTNSAKCTHRLAGNSKSPPILFKNCQEYLVGEIDVLKPDIIVTQGNEARDVIKRYLEDNNFKDPPGENIANAGKGNDFTVLKTQEGKVLICVHHYHPGCRGRFKKNRNSYAEYAKRIKEVYDSLGA